MLRRSTPLQSLGRSSSRGDRLHEQECCVQQYRVFLNDRASYFWCEGTLQYHVSSLGMWAVRTPYIGIGPSMWSFWPLCCHDVSLRFLWTPASTQSPSAARRPVSLCASYFSQVLVNGIKYEDFLKSVEIDHTWKHLIFKSFQHIR